MPLRRSFFAAALALAPAGLAQTPAGGPATIPPTDNLVVEGVPPIPATLADDVWRYTEFRAAAFSSWHPTRREMLVSTRFGNTNQAHVVRAPGGARTQVTFFPERVAGASFEPVASVQSCRALGFGAPRSTGEFPAVYMWGAAGGGPRGLYRSDDAGVTFVRINDDDHEYGGPGNGEFVIGDANVYGRVYMSSAGRGLIMGDLIESAEGAAPQ